MTRFHRGSAVCILALATVLSVSDVHGQQIKVTLLGTGGPLPSLDRFGPSTLIEAGGRAFLFDAGRGALQRLAQVGVDWASVDGVLLTHLHSDHVVGFPDLWLTGWLVRPGRTRQLMVWGPPGTSSMLEHLGEAFAFDLRMRESDDGASPLGAQITPIEVLDEVVYDSAGVRITAFSVDHAPVEPSLGYRIDHRGRSVVISGDTRVSENLIRHATGVDLLIHEVASAESFIRAGVPEDRAREVVARHVTPEQAGHVFARTRPRLALYSHIIHATATDEDLIPGTRREYLGAVEVGVDLMVVVVGDSIDVRRPPGLED